MLLDEDEIEMRLWCWGPLCWTLAAMMVAVHSELLFE